MSTEINSYNKFIADEFIKSNSEANPSTLRGIAADCNILLEYLSEHNKSILVLTEQAEAEMYIEWLTEEKAFSNRTVKRRLCTLRALLRFSQKIGLISSKNKILISENMTVNNLETVSDKTLHRLYTYCSSTVGTDDFITCRAKLAVMLVLLCGFKTSELCRLKISDFDDLDKSEIHLSDCRIRFIAPNMIEPLLGQYLRLRSEIIYSKTDYLFISQRKLAAADEQILRTDFQKIIHSCEIKENISYSALRNTCIKYYYDNIPDEIIVAKMFSVTTKWLDTIKRG